MNLYSGGRNHIRANGGVVKTSYPACASFRGVVGKAEPSILVMAAVSDARRRFVVHKVRLNTSVVARGPVAASRGGVRTVLSTRGQAKGGYHIAFGCHCSPRHTGV